MALVCGRLRSAAIDGLWTIGSTSIASGPPTAAMPMARLRPSTGAIADGRNFLAIAVKLSVIFSARFVSVSGAFGTLDKWAGGGADRRSCCACLRRPNIWDVSSRRV